MLKKCRNQIERAAPILILLLVSLIAACHVTFAATNLELANATNTYEIIDTLKAPGPNPVGIMFLDGFLYNVDPKTGLVYKIDVKTSEYTSFWVGYGVHGICYDGKYFYVSQTPDQKIHQIDPETKEIVATFDAPGPKSANMTFAKKMIWIAESGGRKIYRLSPRNGEIIDYADMPSGTNLHGIEYLKNFLFAIDVVSDTILIIDPLDFEILRSFPLPSDDSHGLSVIEMANGFLLLVTDKVTRDIYLLKIL